ncbi:hypothetical protein BH11PLA2_BH11PLA2_33820 [soil metagenome]
MSTAVLDASMPQMKSKVAYDLNGEPILPKGAEFVDGEIVEKGMSELSNWVGKELLLALHLHVKAQGVGVVFHGGGEQGYKCFPHKPGLVRKPDVSFVRRDVNKAFLSEKGFTRDVPELIAEIVSPSDLFTDIKTRVADFRLAGTKLIWVIDPVQRVAEIYYPDGHFLTVTELMSFTGEDVLPGFTLPLAEILPKVR